VQNSGWEFTLNTINIESKKFRWKTSLNITVNQNKLVAFPGLSSNPNFSSFYIIGKPITDLQLYHCLGVDPQTGVYKFSDTSGKSTFNPSFFADRTALVNTAPKFYGGFRNSFTYGGWQLDFFFQFRKQMGSNPIFSTYFAPGMFTVNNLKSVLNRWQSPGDITNVERFTESFGSNAFAAYSYAQQSDYAYEDASFIRLSNLSLSYQFAGNWLRTIRLQGLQLYLRGQNLFTITKYTGMNPETQSSVHLPILRVITAGLQISM
jgi:hypothetical protein